MSPVMIQLGTAATPNANSCLVYNYYSGASNPTSCAAPSQATSGNNGNAMGYFYQDRNSTLTHSATYSYDGVNRLLTAEADNTTPTCLWGVTMNGGYDQWGNLKTRTVTCGTATALSLSVNGSNQVTNSGFQYDAAGNLIADGTHTYQWDAEGRLQSVNGQAGQSCGGSFIVCYAYNALGQRVQKVQSGSPGRFGICTSSSAPINSASRFTLTVAPLPTL